MTKEEIIERFKTERTRIMSEMLDNPNRYGIYPTTKSYEALDKLYEECMEEYANQKQVSKKALEETFEYQQGRKDLLFEIIKDLRDKLNK